MKRWKRTQRYIPINCFSFHYNYANINIFNVDHLFSGQHDVNYKIS